MLNSSLKRRDNFKSDSLIEYNQINPLEYYKTGYDRGHLCPAANMEWSETALDESFYMSNISPQLPEFNRGIWKKVENFERKCALRDSNVYIVTGGLLSSDLNFIGVKNKIAIPEYFYKIIVDLTFPTIKGIAFLIPNRASTQHISSFVVTIDSVESITGIDFFTFLPDTLQNQFEQTIYLADWGFSEFAVLAGNPAKKLNATIKDPPGNTILIVTIVALFLSMLLIVILRFYKQRR